MHYLLPLLEAPTRGNNTPIAQSHLGMGHCHMAKSFSKEFNNLNNVVSVLLIPIRSLYVKVIIGKS